jgi:hypothetical protein
VAVASSFVMSKSTAVTRERPRQIARWTSGLHHGAITRLMSPSDFGRILKPFASSIMIEGSVRYEDTAETTGVFSAGAVEWFKAGYGRDPHGSDRARGFQALFLRKQELGEIEKRLSVVRSRGDLTPDPDDLIRSLEDRLGVDGYLHNVADDDAAFVHLVVPADPELLPID